MGNILGINQNVSSTKFSEKRNSKRARRLIAKELYIPLEIDEITNDGGYEADAGWFLGVNISKNSCISLYNACLGFVKKLASEYELWKLSVNLRSAITMTFITAYTAVYGALYTAWSTVLSFFYTTTMMVYGTQGKGFKVVRENSWIKTSRVFGLQ